MKNLPESQAPVKSESEGRPRFVQIPLDILRRADLTPADKLILADLADRIGSNGACWPGVRKLAADCGLGRNTAMRSVQRLEALGEIQVAHVEGNPGGKTNTYRLRIASPKWGRTQNGDVPILEMRRTQNGDTTIPREPYQEDNIPDARPDRPEPPLDEPPQAFTLIPEACPPKPPPAGRRRGKDREASPEFRQLREHFNRVWADSNGDAYPWSGPKDAVALNRILSQVGGDLVKAKRIVDRYLADRSDWNIARGHAIAELARNLPAYVSRLNGVKNGSNKKQKGNGPNLDIADPERYRHMLAPGAVHPRGAGSNGGRPASRR